jgi:CO dehydrogenase/acetyl-CoA synthase beta subunit
VTQNVTEREAREAREAFVELVDAKKIEAMKDEAVGNEISGYENGVRYYIVKRAGHHLQNDLQWEEGATQLLEFYDQL